VKYFTRPASIGWFGNLIRHFQTCSIILCAALVVTFVQPVFSDDKPRSRGTLSRNISGEGSCAVQGMSAEQSQLVALQRARAAAIEQVAGVEVTATTLVTDFQLTSDYIKTYSKGFIVREKLEWLPLGQYQKDRSTAPIPEYRVKIVADVYTADKNGPNLGLRAFLDRGIYRTGESANITIKSSRSAKVAIFNITATDEVMMVFPNEYDTENLVPAGGTFVYPSKSSRTDLVLQTIKGHDRDAEAFFVIAMDPALDRNYADIFSSDSLSFSEFFRKFSEIADYAEDAILPYQIFSDKKK
jgi:uncharacterized protein DUF4384